MNDIYTVFVFIFGAIVGSFLNVCIARLPNDESIVRPRSRCPHCKTQIAWYDNIPLLSYAFLKGKCRHCKEKISMRYVVVELMNAVSWELLWLHYGPSPFFVAGIILASLLIVIYFTDFETGLIPDKVDLPGMVAALILCTIWPELLGEKVWYFGLLQSFIGLLAGGGLMLGITLLGDWLFKKESMGGGDLKLLAMIGAFLGWKKAILVFFLGPVISLPFALYVKYTNRSETIPYGPFLAIAAAFLYVSGDALTAYFF